MKEKQEDFQRQLNQKKKETNVAKRKKEIQMENMLHIHGDENAYLCRLTQALHKGTIQF